MTTKHTPGQWSVVEHDHAICVQTESPRQTKFGASRYAVVGGFDRSDPEQLEEARANARLIAAAPDLLEALQWYEAKAVQMGRAAIDQDSKLLLELMKEIAVEYGAQARAAIAKAAGEQP